MLCEKVKDRRTSRKCVLSVFYSIREIRERRKACVACAVGEMREKASSVRSLCVLSDNREDKSVCCLCHV